MILYGLMYMPLFTLLLSDNSNSSLCLHVFYAEVWKGYFLDLIVAEHRQSGVSGRRSDRPSAFSMQLLRKENNSTHGMVIPFKAHRHLTWTPGYKNKFTSQQPLIDWGKTTSTYMAQLTRRRSTSVPVTVVIKYLNAVVRMLNN